MGGFYPTPTKEGTINLNCLACPSMTWSRTSNTETCIPCNDPQALACSPVDGYSTNWLVLPIHHSQLNFFANPFFLLSQSAWT